MLRAYSVRLTSMPGSRPLILEDLRDGFSLLMKVMMKKTYVAYFILGFISVTFLKLPILAVALGALAIALIDFFNSQRADADVTRKPVQPEDAEDGI